jgi:hypothetical protein
MEPIDLMEFRRTLRNHEEMVYGNKASIFPLIFKFKEFE